MKNAILGGHFDAFSVSAVAFPNKALLALSIGRHHTGPRVFLTVNTTPVTDHSLYRMVTEGVIFFNISLSAAILNYLDEVSQRGIRLKGTMLAAREDKSMSHCKVVCRVNIESKQKTSVREVVDNK